MPTAADILGGAARGSTFGVLGAWAGAMFAIGADPGGLQIRWRNATPFQRGLIERIAGQRGYSIDAATGRAYPSGSVRASASGAAAPPIGAVYRTAPTPKNPDFERMMGREVGGKKKAPKPRKPKVRTGGSAADKLGRRGWGWREAGKWLGRRIFIPPWARKLKIPTWARVGAGQVATVAGGIILADAVVDAVWNPTIANTPGINATAAQPGVPAARPGAPAARGNAPRGAPAPVQAPAPSTVIVTEEMPAPVTWLPPVPKPAPEPWWKRAWNVAQPWLPLLLPLALPKAKAPKAPVTNINIGQGASPYAGYNPAEAYLTALSTGGVASTSSKRCECKPKRKRKPKDPRRVCYRGTYIETPTGLKKRRGKRVSCRQSSAKQR